MLNVVRGDLKSKPVASKLLVSYIEKYSSHLNGTLYIGYPIIGTSDGGFQIDALLITKEKGLIAFHIEEGVDSSILYANVQDEIYTKIKSKLFQYKELTSKRELAVEINVVTFAPAWRIASKPKDDYPLLIQEKDMGEYFEKLHWDVADYYEQLVSVLQSITNIRKNKSRDYIVKPDSRGAKLKKLEDSIANLDRQQSSAVIETVDGVQRIRGLAGSGKSIVLALKVAYLHAKNPSWKIAVTFNTRSLKEQFKKFIRMFTYEHINEEPDWDKIDVIHAWGSPSEAGIYFNLCKEHNIEYIDFKNSKKYTSIYGQEFDKVCAKALKEITVFKKKYDVIFIDEAQDFSKEFLNICFKILKEPKRLIYAYDELQSLNKKTMDAPENIFGNSSEGIPLVSLKNEADKPKQDIILFKCYRNPKEILTSAHALGFGIYRSAGLVQMFEHSSLWGDIGYKIENGSLNDGENVTLYRDNDSSPDFLSAQSDIDDIVQFYAFESNEEQVKFIVESIEKNIKEDELKLDDIVVINTDPLTTQDVVGEFRRRLFEKNINSNLAGVSCSPDVFFYEDAITFTGIYRAKGNEAAMVYVINSQYCYSGRELAKKRNILFTAMTRSKAWVRVCGYGEEMHKLQDEFNMVKGADFKLKFIYPTAAEREHMNIVNRDMSSMEKKRITENEKKILSLLQDLEEGKIKKEDLPSEALDGLKALLDL